MMDWTSEVGSGWRPIVEPAIKEIEGLGVKITQVKEKFGGLRIYTGSMKSHDIADQVSAIITKAEAACAVTCENCGRPGRLRNLDGWMKTYCEECSII